jgi:hypothetical protein
MRYSMLLLVSMHQDTIIFEYTHCKRGLPDDCTRSLQTLKPSGRRFRIVYMDNH